MDDYALILNAGSSSLKFCVFQRPVKQDWRLASRGQIEGIGTSPRLTVKDADGVKLADEQLDKASVGNGRDAIDALATWLRSTYGGARVLAVGHRVVHGGPYFSGPTVVDRNVLAQLGDLIPLAPLHQPYNLAAIEARYDAFTTRYEPLARSAASLSQASAFVLRFAVVFDYLEAAWQDPELAPSLLPAKWAGTRARRLARELYRRLLPGALAFGDSLHAER